MKTNSLLKTVILLAFIIGLNKNANAQATSTSHLGLVPAVDWCGWNAATVIPFSIEHRGNQPINFSTNGAQRMVISNGSTQPSGGYIGMGDNLPAGFAPTARLHLHETSTFPNIPNPYLRFTTGPTI